MPSQGCLLNTTCIPRHISFIFSLCLTCPLIISINAIKQVNIQAKRPDVEWEEEAGESLI